MTYVHFDKPVVDIFERAVHAFERWVSAYEREHMPTFTAHLSDAEPPMADTTWIQVEEIKRDYRR